MNLRSVLRLALHPLCVNSVETIDGTFPGVIVLCPRLCWAAQLAELEQVEVLSMTTGARLTLTVLFGITGKVVIPEGDTYGFDPGERIRVFASIALAPEQLAGHVATLVLVDEKRNAPIEIRKQLARSVLREPSFVSLSKREVEVTTFGCGAHDHCDRAH